MAGGGTMHKKKSLSGMIKSVIPELKKLVSEGFDYFRRAIHVLPGFMLCGHWKDWMRWMKDILLIALEDKSAGSTENMQCG